MRNPPCKIVNINHDIFEMSTLKRLILLLRRKELKITIKDFNPVLELPLAMHFVKKRLFVGLWRLFCPTHNHRIDSK